MNTDKWIKQIDQTTASFKNEFGGLTNEQFNWKPNESSWSIAQVMEHLDVTSESYYQPIEAVRNGNYKLPFTGKLTFLVNFFGRFILNAVKPEAKSKIKTFPIWEPSKSNISGDIFGKFNHSQEKLKQFIQGCQDLLDKGTRISSPASRTIVYNLDAAFDIIVTHQLRHLEQARRVLADMQKAKIA
jgi:hypothetical protein